MTDVPPFRHRLQSARADYRATRRRGRYLLPRGCSLRQQIKRGHRNRAIAQRVCWRRTRSQGNQGCRRVTPRFVNLSLAIDVPSSALDKTLKKSNLIAASPLGRVHGLIGSPQEILRSLCVAWTQRDADAGRHVHQGPMIQLDR